MNSAHQETWFVPSRSAARSRPVWGELRFRYVYGFRYVYD